MRRRWHFARKRTGRPLNPHPPATATGSLHNRSGPIFSFMAKPDIITDRIPEWKLQAAVAASLDKRIAAGEPFQYAASLEGVIGNLNPYQARLAVATGVKRGEPDIRLYFGGGRMVPVEMKGAGGSLKPSQRERFPLLEALGFTVHIVKAASEDEAVALVGAIVDAELAK